MFEVINLPGLYERREQSMQHLRVPKSRTRSRKVDTSIRGVRAELRNGSGNTPAQKGRDTRREIFHERRDEVVLLTYRRSGVGLPEADGFRFDGRFVLLDEGWWWCQRPRLVAPMLAESTRAPVQADARQLDEHRVAQLKANGRPTALNRTRHRHREEEKPSIRAAPGRLLART